MAKVLLVNPALAYSSWDADLKKPSPDSIFIRLGLAYLAGALKSKGHEVSLVDFRMLSGWDEYKTLLKKNSPDVIGFSIHSVEFSIAVEAGKIAAAILPKAMRVAGGIHPTMFPEECLKTGAFDYVIQGEGEISFPELIENPSKFPKYSWGKTPDLDQIQFPDREIWSDYNLRMNCEPFGLKKFHFPLPMAELMNTRGCPFNCTFCCGPGEHQLYTRLDKDGKRIPYIRGRSVENVIAELEMLRDKYGIRSAMFHDDQFIMSREWVEEFTQALHDKGFVKSGFKWVTSSKADVICKNEDLIEKMAGAGLAFLIIGFESFSPRILKWFNKRATPEDNFRAAEILHKYGVKIWANYILGIPTDTGWHKEDDIMTVAGVLKVKPIHYSPALYTPVPGSTLFDFYKKNNLIMCDGSVEDMSNRGKMAAKVKGVDYSFLEKIMVDDSVFAADDKIDKKETSDSAEPANGQSTADSDDYIFKAKAFDGSVNIIDMLHKRYQSELEKNKELNNLLDHTNQKFLNRSAILNKTLSKLMTFNPIKNNISDASCADAKFSIVIPVLNGGQQFIALMDKIKKQKKVKDVEILLIDSGSTDGTVEVAAKNGAKIIQIPRESFNHGSTRQLAAEHASGDYVLYTVHDALPASDYLLYKIAQTFKASPGLAALSIRQMVNSDADLYSRWITDITYSSYGFDRDVEYYLQDKESFECLPEQLKRKVSFIDNVCACYSKKALLKYGFKKISNAEDIEAGMRMARNGEHLGFLYSCGVYHWHYKNADYFLKRNYNGMKAFTELLGNEVPNFETLHISSLKDIAHKSWVLYDTIKMSISEWEPQENITPNDFKTFLQLLNETTENFYDKVRKFNGAACDEVSLKNLLLEINCTNGHKGSGNPFKYNHLFSNFNEEMKNLMKYILENSSSLKIGKKDFSEALFKIVASVIGNTLGYWYEGHKQVNKHEELGDMNRILEKGVCFG